MSRIGNLRGYEVWLGIRKGFAAFAQDGSGRQVLGLCGLGWSSREPHGLSGSGLNRKAVERSVWCKVAAA